MGTKKLILVPMGTKVPKWGPKWEQWLSSYFVEILQLPKKEARRRMEGKISAELPLVRQKKLGMPGKFI